jgi:hypothetical protein
MNSLCCPRASHRQYSTIAFRAQQEEGAEPLSGIVEGDETFIQ